MKTGYVYFIQQEVTYAVKIGFTESRAGLTQRLTDLQVGSPYPLRLVHLAPGSWALEKLLHARFAEDRLQGEWFRPSEQLAQAIATLKSRVLRSRETATTIIGKLGNRTMATRARSSA